MITSHPDLGPSARLYAVVHDREGWVCGLVVWNGVVIAAAPLIGWAQGKPVGIVFSYLCRRGAMIHHV